MSLERLQKVAEDLTTACVESVKSEVQKAHAETFETVQSSDVITQTKAFDESHVSPVHSVVSMIRTGDWFLHLTALKSFKEYLFVCDRLNYTRIISLYPAEMEALPKSDPKNYEEFLSGNLGREQEPGQCILCS